jgi:hypothetical protein
MTLPAEERRAINRQNSMHSTGPRSDRGKMKVRQNAMTHGMRAEKIVLSTEDPDALQARADEWTAHYQPANPMEEYLLEQAVKSSVFLDRAQGRHTALLARQVRQAPYAWEQAREDEVERLKVLLKVDADTAVRELQRTGHGCRWLLGRWARLDEILEEKGHWCGPDRDEAIRLLGFHPEPDRLKDSEGAFMTRLYNLLCHPKPAERAIDWLCDPKHMPESLQSTYRADWLPEPANCLKQLREMTAGEFMRLRDLEEQLRTELDEPDRAEAATHALIPQHEPTARLVLRYHTTAENSFYRAYNALKQERKERKVDSDDPRTCAAVVEAVVVDDKAAASPTAPLPNKAISDEPDPLPNKAISDEPDPLPNKANPATAPLPNKANPAPPAPLPNKANPARRVDSEDCMKTTYDQPSGDSGRANAELPADSSAFDPCSIPGREVPQSSRASADPGEVPGVAIGP